MRKTSKTKPLLVIVSAIVVAGGYRPLPVAGKGLQAGAGEQGDQ